MKITTSSALSRDLEIDAALPQETADGVVWPDPSTGPSRIAQGRPPAAPLFRRASPFPGPDIINRAGSRQSLITGSTSSIFTLRRGRGDREVSLTDTLVPHLTSFTGKAISAGDFNGIYRRGVQPRSYCKPSESAAVSIDPVSPFEGRVFR
jgi:hypothetical protein